MSQKPPPKQFVKTSINGTKHTLLVSSAKGGVGKSTVAGNLAFAAWLTGPLSEIMTRHSSQREAVVEPVKTVS